MAASNLDCQMPMAGAKFQVIGAGLPRSGTNSFCAAISYLLEGPAYQAAVQCALSKTPNHALALIDILKLKARQIESQQEIHGQQVKQALADEMHGWVASADAPLCLFVPELLEIHPDAIVICSRRDREVWVESMWKAARLGDPKILYWLYYWVSVLRYSPRMWAAQTPIWRHLYGVNMDSKNNAQKIWDRHHEWLRSVVPPEKLFFVDLKDGWDPICRALGTPVPVNVPFPRLNDGAALEKTMKELAVQGILRWITILGSGAVLVILAWRYFI
ncbi:Hypothetical protein R9X50_00348000 [Acrodontium crateriforme]|uniref:NAD dependent epimerase/dehydratase n=1 Tax=Acrodontium crateriforme TaxID=150365 RepID=A0AAQ3M4D8_9PEZI|nr:Hypothetical protein R9X50_00348000 [Acrodontium crateriforme]